MPKLFRVIFNSSFKEVFPQLPVIAIIFEEEFVLIILDILVNKSKELIHFLDNHQEEKVVYNKSDFDIKYKKDLINILYKINQNYTNSIEQLYPTFSQNPYKNYEIENIMLEIHP